MADTKRPESAVERIQRRVQEKAERRAAVRVAGERAADAPQQTGASSATSVRTEQREAARPAPSVPSEKELPGVHAEKPTDIPARGWLQIVRRAWAENSADNMPIIGAGVAFFAFLAVFPALIATISIYGLVASPAQVTSQIESLSDQLPESAQSLLTDQLTSITQNSGGALTFSLIISILAALWSASGGTGNLITAVNLAYDEVETRGFVKRKAIALGLTIGAIVFVLITFALIAVVPVVLDALPLGIVGTILAQVLRWVLLLGVVAGSLAVLYRLAPDRDAPKMRWVSLGSVVVTVIWAVVSLLFSIYVDNFGSYDKTYGAIAGVIVLMLWLYLTCYLVLLGAEINSETEHQTAVDTTEGDPVPMGTRDATMADELPDPPVPTKESKQHA
ncbi:membrane protein [Modestobacter sp. DSM 44400]|uniref:YihY/virulence factor BrkB family protein n=1 Tax=Modestobacter sp. DSM 44400 TaxID=1550230 RepID=UPI000899A1C5|nr:YihY/virulence factor BrkB family protein [Modestobacter sp. DSM 44400]SDY41048.1 membrane protein [Modestobacter sp. DSM 44400]